LGGCGALLARCRRADELASGVWRIDAVERKVGPRRGCSEARAPLRHCDDRVARRKVPKMTLSKILARGCIRDAARFVALREREPRTNPLGAQPVFERKLNPVVTRQANLFCVPHSQLSNDGKPANSPRVHIAREQAASFTDGPMMKCRASAPKTIARLPP
jgi:hypothetical protein